MKRLALFVGLAALIIALPAAHDVLAKGGQPKVDVCHLNNSNTPGTLVNHRVFILHANDSTITEFYTENVTWYLGRLISVAEPAVEDHVAHGDSTSFSELTDDDENYIENLDDLDYRDVLEVGDPNSSYYQYRLAESDGTSGDVKNANCWFRIFERFHN